MGETLYDDCIRRGDLALLDQWDGERNAPLTPRSITSGSRKRVWWRCPQGHSWQAMVKVRTKGAGCPICAGRQLSPGENDLATVYPALARQWHPTRNGSLTPSQVFPHTHQHVWWQCQWGHEWRASVASRAMGMGCPVCAGKLIVPGVNDLATWYPEVARQWHPQKNAPLTPQDVSPSSNRRVWWLCPQGHAYRAGVGDRTNSGTGCPYCAGRKVLAGFNDLASLEPQLAAQWHPTLNGGLTAEMVTPGSHKMVWWQCPAGHVWKAVVYSRTARRRAGCPICAGRTGKPQRASAAWI